VTADRGYDVGDELDAGGAVNSSYNVAFGVGANSTNVWLLCRDATPFIISKTNATGSMVTAQAGRWQCRIYAKP
jgi:hypothetical protein